MLNSTNVGDGDYFHTFWQEDIHCRFSHATIAAMCSPLYLIWLGFTMSVVVLSQKQKGLDSTQGVQPFFLTSSSCHPKIFVKEFGYFLMSCH